MAIENYVTPEQLEKWTRLGFWDKWTLCDYVKRWAKVFPDKEALIDSRQRMTWAQYGRMMDRMALNFVELGIKRDDLVVCQLPNSVEAIITEFALGRMGACVVPLPMQWREHELAYVLKLTESPVVIVNSDPDGYDYLAMMKGLQKDIPTLKHIVVLGGGEGDPDGAVSYERMWNNPLEEKYPADYLDKNFPITPNDVFTMCFTSGTESDPKGCPRTHNMWKSFERSGFLTHLMENVNDRVLMPIPWINMFGQSVCILPMVMVGGTLVMMDYFYPATVAKIIHQEKITLYPAVPAMHRALLNYKDLDQYDLSSLRVVSTGGAPCPTVLIKQMMERFGCQVWNGFGSNEGWLHVTEVGMDPELVSTTMGTRQLYSEIRIVDEDGREVPDGEVGELCQRAPFTICGYYKRPDLNAKKWDRDGFYHSGDAAFVDEDGYYHFVTRKSDFIISAGMNISAEEVEEVLHKHPAVYDVAVVGMPHEVTGEKVMAYIQLREGANGLSVKDVRNFMKEQKVAQPKWPARIGLVKELPRTPTGKVMKYVLRERLAQEMVSEE